eukprot:PLAT11594.49.p1 GENE.PLAT11594.49~~PLAT11594.49.p1  ORF type:complete len:276 (+),score=120.24 PLAT11594.49:3-830(+)
MSSAPSSTRFKGFPLPYSPVLRISITMADSNTGVCKWFNNEKGYGFITPDEEGADDIFVHHSGIKMEGFRRLNEGDMVSYEVSVDDAGREKAVEVVVTGSVEREDRGEPRERQEITALGALPYCGEGAGTRFLLVEHRERGRRFWSFPRGRAKKDGEVEAEATALQLEKETGLAGVELGEEAIVTSYSYKSRSRRTVQKTTRYYPAFVAGAEPEVVLQNARSEYAWLDLAAAYAQLTHQNSKDVLSKLGTQLGLELELPEAEAAEAEEAAEAAEE